MITSKKKKKIFKYLLGDSAKKSIYLCSFTKLDLKNTSSYLFADVVIGSFDQTRVLKYEPFSTFSLLKKKIKSDQQFAKKIVNINTMKSKPSDNNNEAICPSCSHPVSVDTDKYC